VQARGTMLSERVRVDHAHRARRLPARATGVARRSDGCAPDGV